MVHYHYHRAKWLKCNKAANIACICLLFKIYIMEILNYTPHPIHVWVGEEKKTILPSGLARVEAKHEIQSYIGEIPLYRTVFGEVLGLPEQEKDTFIIVSLVVKSASNRADLISPTDYVRDEKGQILGCKGFSI